MCRPALSVLAHAAWSGGIGNNGQPECRLSAGRVRVVVNVDTSPQPYQRLEREIVEDGQSFGTVRSFTPPQAVSGVGLDAAWLPSLDQLITADRRQLVTVTVSGRAMSQSGRRTLAVRLARASLSSAA
ncbi:MAG TPA: hypothetical protein VLP43_07445 [Solirubrobacteraceae bacterium]|nr:hypothetical protein [Solirubrobacteraceae bacterium]